MWWLKGYLELSNSPLNQMKISIIHAHYLLMLYVSHQPSLNAIQIGEDEDLNLGDLKTLVDLDLEGERPDSRSILYYLQGYFEISEESMFNRKQASIMMARIRQVNTGLSENTVKLFHRISELDCDSVKEVLNLSFVHEVDPSYGLTEGELKESQRIHDSH